ncbi:mitochondrial adenylate kinase [Delphinella strobiligena]|nr:mitochondrial adenylate kinase [Delphinella strobiligena]
MQLRKAARIILVGAPGVGKGTQTERMLQRFPQLASISSGDLLRDNVRRRSVLGIQAEAIMKSGALVPDATILRLIMSELTTRGWIKAAGPHQPLLTLNSMAASFNPLDAFTANAHEHAQEDNYITRGLSDDGDKTYEYSDDPEASFILDGFPRTVIQAVQLDKLIPINLVVQIKTPVDVILDRICNRWIHTRSGRVYNTTFNAPKVPGKDDVTGEPLVQREDDKPETWRARLQKFEETSQPLLDHYDRMGVLWKVQGNSSDEITPKLFDEFARRFAA